MLPPSPFSLDNQQRHDRQRRRQNILTTPCSASLIIVIAALFAFIPSAQAFVHPPPPMHSTPSSPSSTSPSSSSSSSTTTALFCQLLGINSANPTTFSLTWPSFCERGGGTDIHADGWGLAYYQANSLAQFHDEKPASTSPLAQFLGQQPILTKNMLAHIRYATAGEVDLANVHPFSREMWGIQWCFCHNGQVPLFEDHPDWCLCGSNKNNDNDQLCSLTTADRIYHPVGTTDSEAAFCAILNALRSKFTDTMPSLPVLYEELEILCQEIVDYNPQTTIFNFLLTCGPHLLWVYSWPGARPGSQVWNGLHYTIRNSNDDEDDPMMNGHQSGSSKKNCNPNYSVDIGKTTTTTKPFQVNGHNGNHNDKAPTMETTTHDNNNNNQVCVVATKPLTDDEEWVELERGELLVMDAGVPKVSVTDLFRAELDGKGLETGKGTLPPPALEQDMRRYQLEPAYFVGGGI